MSLEKPQLDSLWLARAVLLAYLLWMALITATVIVDRLLVYPKLMDLEKRIELLESPEK